MRDVLASTIKGVASRPGVGSGARAAARPERLRRLQHGGRSAGFFASPGLPIRPAVQAVWQLSTLGIIARSILARRSGQQGPRRWLLFESASALTSPSIPAALAAARRCDPLPVPAPSRQRALFRSQSVSISPGLVRAKVLPPAAWPDKMDQNRGHPARGISRTCRFDRELLNCSLPRMGNCRFLIGSAARAGCRPM